MLQDSVLTRLHGAPEDLLQLAHDWPLCQRFELPPEPVIVVVGAYKGKAIDLFTRLFPGYKRIVGFEPQTWAFEEASQRLGNRRQVWLANVGLGTHDHDAPMGEWHTDAASFVHTGPGTREQGSGRIAEADAALKRMNLSHIDLMVVNIEGGEYELLPHLRMRGILRHIDQLAVQWHLYPETGYDANRMNRDISMLATAGYVLSYDERPAWTYHVRETA